MELIDLIAICITGVGLLNCLSFCVAYQILTGGAWLKDEAGRFLMLFFGCLGSVFAVVIANRVFDDYPGRRVVIIALYLMLVLATFWPMRLLFQSVKHKRKERKYEQ